MGFSLKEGVFIAVGAARAALYNTNDGNVYSINQCALDIIEKRQENETFWRQLVEIGVAEEATEEKASISPLSHLPNKTSGKDKTRTVPLEFVWLEVVSGCNERCRHCYIDSAPSSLRTELNNRSEKKMALSFQDWSRIINEAYQSGAKSCQFIGGEPFLYRDSEGHTLFSLIQEALKTGFESVEIFTNGTLLTDDKVRRLKELGVRVAVSLYSIDPKVHESITRTPGSWSKTMRALEHLTRYGVKTRVEVVVMKWNEEDIEKTVEWIRSKGFEGGADVVRPTGRGVEQALSPSFKQFKEFGLVNKANFYADKSFINLSITGNNCLKGKITISENGDVLPCIFSREIILGNALQEPLTSIVSYEKVQNIWNSSKDNVQVCQDCEYRYVCSDCRALSFTFVPEVLRKRNKTFAYLHAPYPRCTYNPYTGIWGEGVWRLDERGEAHYVNLESSRRR